MNETGTAQSVTKLILGAQAGDRRALNDLLLHITPFVRRLCSSVESGHRAEAVQESLLAVFRGLHTLKEPAAFYGWVRAVTVREAARTARRAGQAPTAELVDRPCSADPSLGVAIADVLERLPSHQRDVLTLRAVYGLEERETARVLSLPVGTVRSRLHRARRSFQDAWR
ncbi:MULTISPECIES: RNA polymerase sigma factor [unclassified Streptomyces]|uniref:RNA polymerase sigma factor n=1 Tax=unclassified Streptomyces TaxID=2593676 RepID=UPI0022B6727F|nr:MULTISPECIES: RNA polymerase sigma factor [unclassified Streptomyces]MCZ7417804.1 RNA polymerase sigma factor [Streptomyces sp. WMMC897]MCZ7432391.1 RNA polymerase sigma factor [Streptomyces sp. WMMC1477]